MTQVIEAVYEHGSFRPLATVDLREGQRVVLSFEPKAIAPDEAEAQLHAWRTVFEGLTEEEIADVEAIALDRRNFAREPRDGDASA